MAKGGAAVAAAEPWVIIKTLWLGAQKQTRAAPTLQLQLVEFFKGIAANVAARQAGSGAGLARAQLQMPQQQHRLVMCVCLSLRFDRQHARI